MTFIVAAVVCLVAAQIAGILCLRAKADLTGSLAIIILMLAAAGFGYEGAMRVLH